MFGLWRWRKTLTRSIEPDEILIDSSNLPQFNTDQLEGRLERPISTRSFVVLASIVSLVMLVYAGRAFDLQFFNGAAYAKQAAENQLSESILFADRGIITDRVGRELAYNVVSASTTSDFAERVYGAWRGLAHTIGYTKAPAKDTAGFYFRTSFEGVDGIERAFDGVLSGINGVTLKETDARGALVSESVQRAPQAGATLALSLDAEVTEGLFDAIAARAAESGYQGGSGVLLDVHTGEVLALTSYPEYSVQKLSRGDEEELATLLADPRRPFLNRAINGLYAPGSIVKPFVAAAALTEGVIDEYTKILSTGSISIPNPYNPELPSVFKDWKAHGWVDMRHAIAFSSDVYFYEVGGGYPGQPGLGIYTLDKYLKLFGFGAPTGVAGFSEPSGTIPTPEWKEATFDGDPWRLGDTYNTSIGQYGVQVTPLQAARAAAALANGGTLFTPTLLKGVRQKGESLGLPAHSIEVAKEGMQLAVEAEGGTAASVNLLFVEVGAKTGTAQVGARNEFMNSWIIGFFPYDKPRYAFAVVLERAPAGTLFGAPAAMNSFLTWLNERAPEYLAPVGEVGA